MRGNRGKEGQPGTQVRRGLYPPLDTTSSIQTTTRQKSRTMIRPTAAQARANYRIWIEFEDGEQGEIDLSHLAGQGVFKAWLDPEFFQDVRIIDNDTVLWGNDIDLCPDALYMELTGKTVDEIWQRSRSGVEFSVPFAPRRGRDVGAVREPPARRGCPNALLRHRDPDALQRSPTTAFPRQIRRVQSSHRDRHPRSFRWLPATENLRPRHRMGCHPRKRTPRRVEPNQPPRNTQQDIAIGVTNPNFLDHFVEGCQFKP